MANTRAKNIDIYLDEISGINLEYPEGPRSTPETPFQPEGTLGFMPENGADIAGEANATTQGGTGNPYIDGVLSGNRWTGSLTFSFPQLASQYPTSYGRNEPGTNFAPISIQQQNAARAILTGTTLGATSNVLIYNSVKDFTNLDVSESNGLGNGTNGAGDLRLAQSSIPGTAYAYYPNNASDGSGGDVWFGTAYAGTSNDYRNPLLGNYAYQTMVHELGHTLGLKHGQETGGPSNVSVPSDRDAIEFTTMSYRSYVGAPTTGYTYEQFGAPQSYMMLDIQALQTMYGADYGYHAGDTTYRWDPNTGQMFLREGTGAFVGQGTPGANRVFLTTWDGGGTDTYDLSNYTTGVSIDLRPGQWSVTSSEQRANLGGGHTAQGNIYNSYLFNNNTASLIENAVGTSSSDTIVGNQANNVIVGGLGQDTQTGNGGNDIFRGTASELNGDTIADFSSLDVIHVTNAGSSVQALQYNGTILSFQLAATGSQTYSITLPGGTAGGVTQRIDAAGGVDIMFGTPSLVGSVSINDVTFVEGDFGQHAAFFTVTRTGGTDAFAVNYASASGTATAGSDYVAVAGVLSFAAGVMSQTISVTINGDTAFEPNETFFVNLSGATNGAAIADNQGLGTIVNDDVRDDFADSFTDTTAPFGIVTAGGTTAGELEIAGDRDWFRVQLTAGARYVIDLSGSPTDHGSLPDPYLYLHDASGAVVGQNDDSRSGLDSQLIYTATASGIYYVEAAAFGDGYTGTYRVSISGDVNPDPDGMPLVNDRYYNALYPDVAAAGIDPESHYNQFGWHEGRDPNPFFSTVGYLAANPDVRSAGIDPLAHYDNHGWHEGRDPSARFDNELYLARNPDVAQAGLDPLAHFLAYGQSEGRQAYAAIGRGNDLAAAHGFDAEYYLLNNPDVARAANGSGTSDSFAFAYQHYEAYGWHEGRNPNTVFDVSGYLNNYGDVRAANIDPLAHYDNYGWYEGRDPSANFDTRAYESHYTDVAAAGINPMTHYLTNGIYEGRLAFADGHLG